MDVVHAHWQASLHINGANRAFMVSHIGVGTLVWYHANHVNQDSGGSYLTLSGKSSDGDLDEEKKEENRMYVTRVGQLAAQITAKPAVITKCIP